jgi:hypothetical protein
LKITRAHSSWRAAPQLRSLRQIRGGAPQILKSRCPSRRFVCCVACRDVMTDALTAVDIARRLADVLERHSIRYAIGGALALAYYAPPRATIDVDINVFVPPRDGMDRLLNILAEAGFAADNPADAAASAADDGQFRGRVAGIRVDVFVPAIQFYEDLAAHTRRVPLLDRPIEILGPEDLLTLKMMFFRRKDLADVEAVLRGPAETVDIAVVRSALIGLVGEKDDRVMEWDKIVKDVGRHDV